MHRSGSVFAIRNRSALRSLKRSASLKLSSYILKRFPQKVSVPAILGACKNFGSIKVAKSERMLKRLSGGQKTISAKILIEHLNRTDLYEQGKILSEDAINRIYANFVNDQGKLPFEYLMKMGEINGVALPQKMAKGIVRRYGNRKDHVTKEDIKKLMERRQRRIAEKLKGKK